MNGPVTEEKGSTKQEDVLRAPKTGEAQITAMKAPMFALKVGGSLRSHSQGDRTLGKQSDRKRQSSRLHGVAAVALLLRIDSKEMLHEGE